MLIPSERHTAEDLRLWAEYEAADRVHGERFAFSGKVERSIQALREAAKYPHWIGCSWGKDSVCLAHIAYRAGVQWPLVFFHFPGHEPFETEIVRNSWMSRFPRTDYREIEAAKPLKVGDDRFDLKPSKKTGGDMARAQWGRWCNGIRADESGRRAIYLRKFGVAGCRTAISPIGWWTTADVFGYLAHYDLPTHANYAMLGGGRCSREHIRVSPLGGIMGDQMGRAEWEREYYGDVLRRLQVT